MTAMNEQIRGMIVKATGGFYYVAAGEELIECRARGLFRKEGITPYVGDHVVLERTGENGYITVIEERKNYLIRPPLANLDQLIIVVSVDEPPPNLLIIDKMIAIACYRGITPVIVVTKTDLEAGEYLQTIYRSACCQVIMVSNLTSLGSEEVRILLSGKVSAFCGNTGVGKSSLLNCLDPALNLATDAISQKLGRGKHTTRTVELFRIGGGYIADTPGFSAIETERLDPIRKEALQYCFSEFEEYIPHCRFTGCSHTKEKDCAVLAAVEKGEIAQSRHQSYLAMYEEQKMLKEWEIG